MITAYFFMACAWVILWPFVRFLPFCGRHRYVGPGFAVLSVAVLSPLKVTRFVYKSLHKDDPEDSKKAQPVVPETPAPNASPAPQAMNNV